MYAMEIENKPVHKFVYISMQLHYALMWRPFIFQTEIQYV